MAQNRLYTTSRSASFGLENVGVGDLDVWGAAGRHAYDDSFSLRTLWHQYAGTPVTEEEFSAAYGDSGIPYDPNMTEELAEFLAAKKQRREMDEYVLALGKGGWLQKSGQFAAEIIGGNLTPVNIAASFLPIGAPAKWAAVGLKCGMLQATAARGLAGGAIGQAMLEPLTHYERGLEGRSYGLRDSAASILMSGVFGAGLHSGLYGFKKLKDRFFATPESLAEGFETGNPAVDNRFKELVESLRGKKYPEGSRVSEGSSASEGSPFDLTEALQLKNDIWQEGLSKFPEFFAQERKTAGLEDALHQEFATGGDRAKIPDSFLKQLDSEHNKLESLRSAYGSNAEFLELQERLADIDSGILNRLEEEQRGLRAYDLDERDVYTAARQLEEGNCINLEDPASVQSIFDLSEITQESKQSNNQPFEQASYNSHKLAEAIKFIDQYEKSPSEGLKDWLKQADLRQMTVAQEHTGGLLHDLSKADLLEQYQAKSFETDIAWELYNMTASRPRPTRSKQAKAIAEIIHKRQIEAVARANRAGADISWLPGYITRQSHNSDAMRKSGYQKWRSFILPLLDLKAMDKDFDLQQVFNNLATGEHLYNIVEYLPGSLNVAHNIEAARKLHFKSPDGWLKYNAEFGTHSLAESIALNLEKLGKVAGILESLGSSPMETLKLARMHYAKSWQQRAASNDKHAIRELEFLSNSRKPDHILDLILGNVAPEQPLLAKINSSWNSLRVMADLGGVVLSSIPDAATFAAEQMNSGIGVLTAHANILKALTHSFSSKQKKEFALLLGCATDNLLGNIHRELTAENAVPGFLNKAVNIFMRLNLMSWWDNSFKSALGLILSHNLAQHLQRPYASAPLELRQLLRRYDIDEHNWQIYRHLIEKAEDGRLYALPTKEIPKVVLAQYLEENAMPVTSQTLAKLQGDIVSNLRRYLRDRVDTGIPQTHVSQRYLTTLGANSGTPLGAALRMLMQYKQYPVNYMARSLKDYTAGQLPLSERTGTLSDIFKGAGRSKIFPTLLITSTALGYLSIGAKKMVKGEEVPDPADYGTWEHALIKGGGLGFYGEFLFGQYNKHHHRFLDELLGPRTADMLVDVPSIMTDIKRGNIEEAKSAAARLACRNFALGHSLFYLPIAASKLFDLDSAPLACRFK